MWPDYTRRTQSSPGRLSPDPNLEAGRRLSRILGMALRRPKLA